MISTLTNPSVDTVSKYVYIATDLYFWLYLYNFGLSSFSLFDLHRQHCKEKKTSENVYFFLSAATNSYLMHDV